MILKRFVMFEQLGSVNLFGIQGQDYLFVNGTPPGQGDTASYSTPAPPTIYSNDDWIAMTCVFQDQNLDNLELIQISHRNITAMATCKQMRVLDGGNGTITFVTYIDDDGEATTLNVAQVGSAAVTYIGVLKLDMWATVYRGDGFTKRGWRPNPRADIFQVQQHDLGRLSDYDYLHHGMTADAFQMPDQQAKIIAGARGWSGCNHTPGDSYQFVRYCTESWWSPNDAAEVIMISERIMEFSIEAVAATDYNGPRRNVTGW